MSTTGESGSGSLRHIGKYEIREPLGRGGMAEVWKAWDSQLERYVAIKVLHGNLQHDPDFVKRFAREAKAVASLHHPNIVQAYEFQTLTEGGDQGARDPQTSAYMVMDYIEGPTLDEYIHKTSRRGKFPSAQEIIYLFTAIGRAIDYAHQRGMIHRDIKPANILLDQRYTIHTPIGEPILTDFGIVKLMGTSTNTLSGAWLGTPSYISPEQARGERGNERSDIYSLGVILYEVCTGVRPFSGATPVAIIMQHIQMAPVLPSLINPYISPALSEVILRSLQKDPFARFSSASEMAAALEQAFASSFTPGIATNNLSSGSLSPRTSSPALHTPASGDPVLMSPPPVASTPQFQSLAETNPPLIMPDSLMNASPLPTSGTANPAFSPLSSLIPPAPSISNSIAPAGPPIQAPASTLPPSRPIPPRPRRRGLFVGLLVLVVLLLAATGLSVYSLLPQTQRGGQPVIVQVVGHAYFGSTGQLNDQTTQGIDDTLQLNLSNIAPPGTGKAYYLWALSDTNQNPQTSLLLGKLAVTSGKVNFFYPGDSQHSDLLGTYSRLLITEEGSTISPLNPSSDRSTWRYHAELPQTIRSIDNQQTAMGDLRAMLYKPSEADILPSEAYGGFFTPFMQNTKTISQLAKSARESWNKKDIHTLRNQLIEILDYIDGVAAVPSDVPPGTPLLVKTRIPLIEQNPQLTPSYVDHISDKLDDLIIYEGLSSDMKALASRSDLALLDNVQVWLNSARLDATGLVTISDAQLLESSTGDTLNDLQTQLNEAYNGQFDPVTGKLQQEGELQIFNNIHSLTNFDLRPYQAPK